MNSQVEMGLYPLRTERLRESIRISCNAASDIGRYVNTGHPNQATKASNVNPMWAPGHRTGCDCVPLMVEWITLERDSTDPYRLRGS